MNQPAPTASVPTRAQKTRLWIELAVMALIIDALPWAYVVVDQAAGSQPSGGSTAAGGAPGQGLWILIPTLVAFGLYLGTRRRGIKLGMTLAIRPVWWLTAIGLSALFASLTPAVGMLTGTVHLNLSSDFVAVMGGLIGFQLVKNVAEEFIFRGYLTRVTTALSITSMQSHLLVGAVWALWHLPLFVLWTPLEQYQQMSSVPLTVFLPLFVLGTLALAVIFGELRERSGSIWPGVVLHTLTGTLIAALLTDGLIFTGHSDLWFSPNTFSVGAIVVFVGAGIVLRGRKQQLPAAV